MSCMHLVHSIEIQPKLELKIRPKQLLGYLPLELALPRQTDRGLLYWPNWTWETLVYKKEEEAIYSCSMSMHPTQLFDIVFQITF